MKLANQKMVYAELESGDGFDPHGFFVYLLWGDDSDRPIYVGQSTNVLLRLGTHIADAEKRSAVRRVQLVRCENRSVMTRTELALIREYRPRMNIAGKPLDEDARGA